MESSAVPVRFTNVHGIVVQSIHYLEQIVGFPVSRDYSTIDNMNSIVHTVSTDFYHTMIRSELMISVLVLCLLGFLESSELCLFLSSVLLRPAFPNVSLERSFHRDSDSSASLCSSSMYPVKVRLIFRSDLPPFYRQLLQH